MSLLAVLPASAEAAPTVYAESASVKVRPDTALRTAPSIALTAARNEFVSFQVVVNGGDSGAKGVTASFEGLEGPASIRGPNVTLYREAYLNITKLSGNTGKTGLWPDGLVPDTDEIAGEKRNAFPFDVPRAQSRAIWVDVLVPQDAPPGSYRGEVRLSGNGLTAQVPVELKVVDAELPSTPSLASAFLIFTSNVCRAHTGAADCGGAEKQAELMGRYQRLALEHRFTLPNFYALPGGNDWSQFDRLYGPYLDGTAPSRLPGAKMTSAQLSGPKSAKVAAKLSALARHFEERGWLDRAYDYTGDEPPYGVSFSEVLARAKTVQSVSPSIRTLLTTNIDAAKKHGLAELLDVISPVVNHLDGTSAPFKGSQSGKYDAWLRTPGRELWVYQSCMSHGCSYGTNAPENQGAVGWPSYMVDRSGAKNRAMQWVAFLEGATGELYYETAHKLPSAWKDVFDFNGNGDGTLFYPGTPAAIGGTTQVPVASIRMKLIRQGMQDYEWLKLVADAGDADFARRVAREVVPAAYRVGDDGAAFDSARLKLIARYEELTARTTPSSPVPEQPAPTPSAPEPAPAEEGTPQAAPVEVGAGTQPGHGQAAWRGGVWISGAAESLNNIH